MNQASVPVVTLLCVGNTQLGGSCWTETVWGIEICLGALPVRAMLLVLLSLIINRPSSPLVPDQETDSICSSVPECGDSVIVACSSPKQLLKTSAICL